MRHLSLGRLAMFLRLRSLAVILAAFVLGNAPAGAWAVDPSPPQLTADYTHGPKRMPDLTRRRRFPSLTSALPVRCDFSIASF